MFNTIIYNFCCFLGIHLPLPFLYFIARVTALIRYLFLRESRKNVIENLRIALEYRKTKTGVSYTEKELRILVKKTFYNFARNLTDFSYVPKWTLSRVKNKVTIENIELLDEGLSHGKGVIALTAHIGNWELAGIVSSILGYKVSAVSIPYLNPAVTNLYVKRRNTKGLEVILTGSNPKNILKALKENRILAVLGDRVFTEKGTKIPFMGIDTAIPRGPATLAVKTGAVFVAGFFIMEGENYRFFFKKIPPPPSSLAEDEKINFLLLKGVEIIEKTILEYPEQWLTFTPLFNPPTETG